jgi:hypothetical protein
MVPAQEGNYEDIERGAFERYILDLVRGYAAEQERVHRKAKGTDPHILIREAKLEGEYPRTVIRIRRYEPNRDIESWHTELLWEDTTFFDAETGGRLASPGRMASDILMRARGG